MWSPKKVQPQRSIQHSLTYLVPQLGLDDNGATATHNISKVMHTSIL